MLEFGLPALFYQFDIGFKSNFFYLLLLSLLTFFLIGKIGFKKIPLFLLWGGMICFNALILYMYDIYFGIFLTSFLSIFFLLALWDIRYLYVPLSLNFLAVLIGVCAIIFVSPINLLYGFAFCGFLSFLQVCFRAFKRESLGDGDIVFALPFGMVFGLEGSFVALFLASLLGAICFVFFRAKSLPFIALLFFGVLLSFLLGVVNV